MGGGCSELGVRFWMFGIGGSVLGVRFWVVGDGVEFNSTLDYVDLRDHHGQASIINYLPLDLSNK